MHEMRPVSAITGRPLSYSESRMSRCSWGPDGPHKGLGRGQRAASRRPLYLQLQGHKGDG